MIIQKPFIVYFKLAFNSPHSPVLRKTYNTTMIWRIGRRMRLLRWYILPWNYFTRTKAYIAEEECSFLGCCSYFLACLKMVRVCDLLKTTTSAVLLKYFGCIIAVRCKTIGRIGMSYRSYPSACNLGHKVSGCAYAWDVPTARLRRRLTSVLLCCSTL